jgi:pimeloyl-ACP methyl ester carboxylesterase
MKVRNVAVDDTLFLVREWGSGDGTPVLLLHGVPETSSMWRDVAPALAAQGRRVLAPDLPGLGGSSYPGPFDVPSVTHRVRGLLEAEVGDGAVDVVGHDWGGSVALELAGGSPERERRLAVANTAYRYLNPVRAVHFPLFSLPVLPELAFRLGGTRVVDALLALGWKSDVVLDPELKAEYVAAYSEPVKVQAMLGYYRAAVRPRLKAALRLAPAQDGPPQVKAEEMLVIWGAADPVLPISIGEGIVRDLGSTCDMVTIPGAGHFVVDEAPDVVRDTLVTFLAEG